MCPNPNAGELSILQQDNLKGWALTQPALIMAPPSTRNPQLSKQPGVDLVVRLAGVTLLDPFFSSWQATGTRAKTPSDVCFACSKTSMTSRTWPKMAVPGSQGGRAVHCQAGTVSRLLMLKGRTTRFVPLHKMVVRTTHGHRVRVNPMSGKSHQRQSVPS